MDLQYTKGESVKLKSLGLDEKWLQDKICEDTSIIGLGDLTVFKKEKVQPTGGRIDIVMNDPEDDFRYEIEIMLGTLDESHIIRTIEYWDVERKRYPSKKHIAVIIAEDITNRFFNVIGLLNQAIKIIAIQLNAIKIENNLVLNFVKVLDLPDEEEDDENEIVVNRKYWETRSGQKSLMIMDQIINLVDKIEKVKVNYNQTQVALSTTGKQFCWLYPRKGSNLYLHLRVSNENKERIINELKERGIETGNNDKNSIKIVLIEKELKENEDYIIELLKIVIKNSNK